MAILITCGSQPRPGPTSGSAGLVRVHVADGRKCATDIRRPAEALAVDVRSTSNGRGFYRSTMRHRDSLSERRPDARDRGRSRGRIPRMRNAMEPALLFDQPEQRAPAPALRRFWLTRCFR